MTKLLVSVRSAEEALAALAGGADIIDVKDPTWPLGKAEESVWREVVAAVEQNTSPGDSPLPISVALGELYGSHGRPGAEPRVEFAEVRYPSGISFAKVGMLNALWTANWRDRWIEWRKSLPAGIEPVAVSYEPAYRLHAPSGEDILQLALDQGAKTFLLDTYDKGLGSLLEMSSKCWIRKLGEQLREAQMTFAIAGSLRLEDIPAAIELQADIVAVRTAACAGGREGTVSAALVRQLRQALNVNF